MLCLEKLHLSDPPRTIDKNLGAVGQEYALIRAYNALCDEILDTNVCGHYFDDLDAQRCLVREETISHVPNLINHVPAFWEIRTVGRIHQLPKEVEGLHDYIPQYNALLGSIQLILFEIPYSRQYEITAMQLDPREAHRIGTYAGEKLLDLARESIRKGSN